MRLSEKINKTLMTGLAGLALLAGGCTTDRPCVEIYVNKDKNYIEIKAPDGRILKDSVDHYAKFKVSDSIRYEIDGTYKSAPLYEHKQDTTRNNASDDDVLEWLPVMIGAASG